MALSYSIIQSPPKALCFDVFGTVVNWRETVVSTLIRNAAMKTSSSSRSAELSPEIRRRLSELNDQDWEKFSQEWRDSYKEFTQSFKPGETSWRDIDTHHYLSLVDLLQKWQLEGMYSLDETRDLSRVWHFLDPWADSAAGLHKLGKKFITSTLSNGNQELLKDLNEHGDLGFKMIQSSGDFKAYKPHPKYNVYKGAAKQLGVEPEQCAMVAAHLGDLKAAKECGFRTIYVERKDEEDWDREQHEFKEARTWVDLWISQDKHGFLEVAHQFGIS